MFQVVQFSLLPFRFIRVSNGKKGVVFEGRACRVHHDDRVEGGVDGIVMSDERV